MQILWSNLLTDGLLGLGMGFEAPEKNVMNRPPFNPKTSIFGEGLAKTMISVGVFMGAIIIGIVYFYWMACTCAFTPLQHIQISTFVFALLAFLQAGSALSFRSFTEPFYKKGFKGNKILMSMLILVLLLQIIVIYTPFLQPFFKTTPLSLTVMSFTLVGLILIMLAIDLPKQIRYFKRHS